MDELIAFVIAGSIAGVIARLMRRKRTPGLAAFLIVGILAALLGGWMSSDLDLATHDIRSSAFLSFIEASVALVIFTAVSSDSSEATPQNHITGV